MPATLNSRPTLLITGGNGYIGSSIAYSCHKMGFSPLCIDNFSTSRKPKDPPPWPLLEVDITQKEAVLKALSDFPIPDAIFHLAAFSIVPESFQMPEKYRSNNVQATKAVAEVAQKLRVPLVVHSSSCSVYGKPEHTPIDEHCPIRPISPYGETKVESEQVLNAFAKEGTFKVAHLRYFNPAGAIKGSNCGERHHPETHLIPRVVVAAMRHKSITVFGKNYPTPDGTCIRDYIHIEDLAHAHLLALTQLKKVPSPLTLNIGRGYGNSVLEVVRATEAVFGHPIPIDWQWARTGDAPILFSDTTQMKSLFQWTPEKDLKSMIDSHWQWEKNTLQ